MAKKQPMAPLRSRLSDEEVNRANELASSLKREVLALAYGLAVRENPKPALVLPEQYVVGLHVTTQIGDSPFASDIDFTIDCIGEDEDEDGEFPYVLVGRGSGVLMHLSAWQRDQGIELPFVFDAVGHDTYAFFEALFEPGKYDRFAHFVQGGHVGAQLSDLLIINGLRLDKDHHGKNVDLLVVAMAIRTFIRYGGITAICISEETVASMGEEPEEGSEAAVERLRRHFGQLGFRHIGRGFMVCGPADLTIRL